MKKLIKEEHQQSKYTDYRTTGIKIYTEKKTTRIKKIHKYKICTNNLSSQIKKIQQKKEINRKKINTDKITT